MVLYIHKYITPTVIPVSAIIFLSLLISRAAEGVPAISDNNLKVETVAQGLSSPTSMAFIDSKNILILEKNTGKVRLISNGILKSTPILTVSVNSESERGLLGAATLKTSTVNGNTKFFVFLYYTTESGGQLRNKLYRQLGPMSRTQVTPDQLVNFPGFKYHDPVFSWKEPVAVTGLAFFHSSKLGSKYQDNLFVGDYENGNLYFFKVKSERTGLIFDSSRQGLKDLVADDQNEVNSIKFGSGFNGITDIKRSPDGLLYVVSINDGKVYRIVPK